MAISDKSQYYQVRINKAIKYLNAHLDDEIQIQKLAEVSCFSLFHFQRIYRSLQGESPYETLLRLRLEKAIFLLQHRPNLKIGEVALESGFPSNENFSRQFKARFKVSPSAFRKDKALQKSRIYQETHPNDFYSCIEESRQTVSAPSFPVVLEELPAIPIAFVRAIFGADGSGLVERYHELMKWAAQHNISYQGKLNRFGMSIDNPEVTPADKYRYDFAIRTKDALKPDGLIEMGEIPMATYATVHCQGKLQDVAQAWDFLYKEWLPASEFTPLHYPAIEEFVQGPEEIGWENFNLKCRIPVTKIIDHEEFI